MGIDKDDFHALIVAGGKGSRSENPLKPKILQEIMPGRNLASFHLENLQREQISKVTFLLGYKFEEVIKEIEKLKPIYSSIQIDYRIEVEPLGTYGSVKNAVQTIQESRILVIYGDILINANYRKLLEIWYNADTSAAVIVHPNLHPEDSDLVLTDTSNLVTLIGKQKKEILNGLQPLRAMAGVYLFKRSVFAKFTLESGDLTQDFLFELVFSKSVLAINSSDFFSDTGTPERLLKVKNSIASGHYFRRGNSKKIAVFIDRDGTIIQDLGTTRNDLFPGEITKDLALSIKSLNQIGVIILMVTNQPGIAKGQIALDDVHLVEKKIENELLKFHAIIDDYKFCPHHPDKGFPGERSEYKKDCECRKPKTQMITELSYIHNIDLSKSFMIGDTWRDEFLASSTHLEFYKIEIGNRLESLNSILDQIRQRVLR